jgi:hypothetical protein
MTTEQAFRYAAAFMFGICIGMVALLILGVFKA